jgi:ERCC4-type nuclease
MWSPDEDDGEEGPDDGDVVIDDDTVSLRGIFVAPTEPLALRTMGKVHTLPERFGCDVLWMHGGNRYGIQRKEWHDLLASVADGRLVKEIGQMRSGNVRGVVVIEGPVSWTTEGEIVTGYVSNWDRNRWWSVQLAIQLEGVWVITTPSLADTIAFVRTFNTWTKKRAHGSLSARPGAKGVWGTRANDRDWAKHLLTGFPGLGPGNADKIYDAFGRAPIKWDCEMKDLLAVPGIGPKKAIALWKALGGDDDG